VSPHGIASPIQQIKGTEALASGGNQIVFEDARVSDVVSQFNSRNRIQIRVTDRQLAARRVTGTFDADDPQSFVAFLQAVAGASTAAMVSEVAAAPPVSGQQASTMHR
jgi:ferric-dicitrate binding protein FerR (iron transport regulator)